MMIPLAHQSMNIEGIFLNLKLINVSRPYIPARSQWNQRNMTPVMNNRALSPIQASPPQLSRSPPRPGARAPSAADNYVEDIDPRFAEPSIPTVLMPGPSPPTTLAGPPLQTDFAPPAADDPALRYGGSSESLPDSQRSPAASDASHYTSISQRGVNPAWRPGGPAGAPLPQRPNDALLAANPDFALPGAGRGRGGGGRGRGSPPRGPPQGRYPGAF